MIKKLFVSAAALMTLGLTTQAQNQSNTQPSESTQQPTAPAPVLSPRVEAKGELTSVQYGQPSKRGRVIFGELVPYNQLWRTGANMSTDVTFHHDVDFAGVPVKAGTYSLFTIPGEQEWTVILNAKPAQRGASEYEKYKDQNVAEVKVPVAKTQMTEALTIVPGDTFLDIIWDEVKVSVPVQKK